jgi:hypothetical protein
LLPVILIVLWEQLLLCFGTVGDRPIGRVSWQRTAGGLPGHGRRGSGTTAQRHPQPLTCGAFVFARL